MGVGILYDGEHEWLHVGSLVVSLLLGRIGL